MVEDERKVAEMVSRGLRAARYAVDVAPDGETGWTMVNSYPYDLVILDLILPGIGGLSLLKHLRNKNINVSVLVLTATDSTQSKIENFEAGADDYLTKPFAFGELQVRVKALLRRGPIAHNSIIRIEDLEIDRLSQMVRRGGKRVELTPKEYALLEYLATEPKRVFTRSMIVEHVWDHSFEGLTTIVDVYVRHLREKLDTSHSIKLIKTVRGVGYSLGEPDDA